ncbi:MAG: hypothetical protein KAX20_02490, partial [Candidatus Omnitrophica bacterium]|nr:hypothetical protein [Candidatus Omnitrophota bacterium]
MAKLGEHADKAVSIKFEHLKKPGGLAKRHYRLANRAAKYVLAGLERPWPDSDAMRFGKHPKSASSVQPLRNSGHGLWGNARAAVGLAILSKVGSYDPSLAGGASREEICRVAQAIIKYVALSHSTQDPRFTCDVTQYRQFKEFGPEWGLSWQSPAYAAELALGAWLLWEHLSPDVRTVVNNILTAEVEFNLDRPTYLKMPGRCNCDPNVWTGLPNAYAVNMLPEDARCDTWGEDMFRWMFNSFGLPEDLTSNHIVDARPLKERMEYASLNEDCTMENHGFFHPQYLHIYNLLQQAALPFGLAGNPIPEVIGLHRKVIFERIKSQVSWEGHFFYSNGFDWRPFAGAQEMGAWMHMLYGDADGAALEKKGVESKEVSMNRFNTGAVEKDVEDVESDGHNVSSLGSSAKLYLGHCLFLPEVKPTPWEEMNCAQ